MPNSFRLNLRGVKVVISTPRMLKGVQCPPHHISTDPNLTNATYLYSLPFYVVTGKVIDAKYVLNITCTENTLFIRCGHVVRDFESEANTR